MNSAAEAKSIHRKRTEDSRDTDPID